MALVGAMLGYQDERARQTAEDTARQGQLAQVLQMHGQIQTQQLQQQQLQAQQKIQQIMGSALPDAQKQAEILRLPGGVEMLTKFAGLQKDNAELAQRDADRRENVNALALGRGTQETQDVRLGYTTPEASTVPGSGGFANNGEPISVADKAAIDSINARPGVPTTIGIGSDPALNPLTVRTQTKQVGGLFAPLMESDDPAIVRQATILNGQMQKSGNSVPYKVWEGYAKSLSDAEQKNTTARGEREDRQGFAAALAANGGDVKAALLALARDREDRIKREGEDKAKEAKTKYVADQVVKLQASLEKAGLPEIDGVIGKVEDAFKKTPNIAYYITGPLSTKPDWAVSKEVQDGRMAMFRLFNITLKNRSGAAVTNQELERLKQEFGQGFWKTPQQLRAGVDALRDLVKNHYTSIAAGLGPDVLGAYNDNVRSLGGRVVLEVPEGDGWSIKPKAK